MAIAIVDETLKSPLGELSSEQRPEHLVGWNVRIKGGTHDEAFGWCVGGDAGAWKIVLCTSKNTPLGFPKAWYPVAASEIVIVDENYGMTDD